MSDRPNSMVTMLMISSSGKTSANSTMATPFCLVRGCMATSPDENRYQRGGRSAGQTVGDAGIRRPIGQQSGPGVAKVLHIDGLPCAPLQGVQHQHAGEIPDGR